MKTLPPKREKGKGPLKETYTYKKRPTNNKRDGKKQIYENNATKEGKSKRTYKRDVYI